MMSTMRKNKNAVSEVVSALLSITIVVSISGAVLFYSIPYIEKIKVDAQQENMLGQFNIVADSLEGMIHEKPGASRKQIINMESGSITTNSNGDRFVILYASTENYNFTMDDLDDSDAMFNVTFSSGTVPPLSNFYAKVYRYNDDPLLRLKACEDISFNDYSGTTCTYLTFDLRPLYNLTSNQQIQLLSTRLRLTSPNEPAFQGKDMNIRVSHLSDQIWDENWDYEQLQQISISHILKDACFSTASRYSLSTDLLDIFLPDLVSQYPFFSIRIDGQNCIFNAPGFKMDSNLLHVGSISNNLSFYSHKINEYAPELIINYVELKNNTANTVRNVTEVHASDTTLDRSTVGTYRSYNKEYYNQLNTSISDASIVARNVEVSGFPYQYSIENDLYTAYFSNRSSSLDTHTIAVVKNRYAITFSPGAYLQYVSNKGGWFFQDILAQQLSTASIEENRITYPCQYGAGIDLQYIASRDNVKENLVIKERSLLPRPTFDGASLSLLFHVNAYNMDTGQRMGLRYGNTTADFKRFGCFMDMAIISAETFYFTDEQGSVIFTLPEFYAWDSKIPHEQVLLDKMVRMTQSGDLQIAILVPWSWLNDSTTVYPVVIDPTIAVNSYASDGFIYKTDTTTYINAQTAVSGTVDSASTTARVGQQFMNVGVYKYRVDRAFLFFDTSSIPIDATITSATLSIYGFSNSSANPFSIIIQDGQPTYPHDPLQTSDYNKSNYNLNGGFLSTLSGFSTLGYNVIPLNSTGLTWITKGGITKLCLRSNLDISAKQPTKNEYVTFYTSEQAGTSADPQLSITYTLPKRANQPSEINNPYPENKSTGIELLPILGIDVSDLEGDPMTVNWSSNSTGTGTWQKFATNASVLNGTYHRINLNFTNPGTTYYWNVSVWDGTTTNTSGIYHFTTNYPPYQPYDPIPGNESTYVDPTALKWTGGDPDSGDTVTYDVYFEAGDSTPDTLVSNDQSGTTYLFEDLNFGCYETYYWKIVAYDDKGNSNAGPIWSFQTKGWMNMQLNDNSLEEGMVINTSKVSFSWNATGCDAPPPEYTLQYSYKLDGYISQWTDWTTDTSKTYYDLPDGTYTFYLKGMDPSEPDDPQTISFPFTVIKDHLQNPEILDPTKNGNVFTFTCQDPLQGTVRIDLYNGIHCFGRIYLFDLGALEYELSSASGTYRNILECNSILSIISGQGSIKKGSMITTEDSVVSFQIVQMRNKELSTGGSGTLQFNTDFQENYVREMFNDAYNIKVQVYGLYSYVWLGHLVKLYGFHVAGDGHTVLHPRLDQKSSLLLTQAVCKIDFS